MHIPLAKAQSAVRRPEGEGANLHRRERNLSRRRFGRQTGEKLRRNGTTKVRVFTALPETTLQRI